MYMYIGTLPKWNSQIVSYVNLSLSSLWLFCAFRDFFSVAIRLDQSIFGACRYYERVSGIVEARKLGCPQNKKPIDPDHRPVLKVLCTVERKKINRFLKKNTSYIRPLADAGNRSRLNILTMCVMSRWK